jgi:arsenite-transporting ATPase
MAKPSFLYDQDQRLLLFSGKGGVGKTTCATATALGLTTNYPRNRYLLVSTDPAHSLADSLAGAVPPGNLTILELEAAEWLTAYKAKHGQKFREIAARGTFLDDQDIKQFLELSLPGLDELMAFLEISRWVENRDYDCIIVDTAPTGHTLRLLTIPELLRQWLGALDTLLAKHRYMKKLFSGYYRPDEVDKFLMEEASSVKRVEALLQDAVQCHLVPVLLAEELVISETLTLLNKLADLKIPVTQVVINRLYPESACPVCAEGRARQMSILNQLATRLTGYTIWGVPLYPQEIRGPDLLQSYWEGASELTLPSPRGGETELAVLKPLPRAPQVERAARLPSPETKLLIFAGKGGVGKTTMACATAIRLAQVFSGKEVFLFSIDPAHSLAACLDLPIGPHPTRIVAGLTAMEVDAQLEFQNLKTQYAAELERFLQSISPHLDLTFDRQVMERIMDLSPPGIDEVISLSLVIEFMEQGTYDIFILDSAPTGHLIRFLELPELIDQWLKVFFGLFLKYKQIFRLPQVSQKLVRLSKDLKYLRTLLRDSRRASLYAVTILTEMAFQETKDLLAACARLGINVPQLFLNLATPDSECTLCSALYQRESQLKAKFQRKFPGQHQTLVYRQSDPRGWQPLTELGQYLYQSMVKENHHGGAFVDLPALSC